MCFRDASAVYLSLSTFLFACAVSLSGAVSLSVTLLSVLANECVVVKRMGRDLTLTCFEQSQWKVDIPLFLFLRTCIMSF